MLADVGMTESSGAGWAKRIWILALTLCLGAQAGRAATVEWGARGGLAYTRFVQSPSFESEVPPVFKESLCLNPTGGLWIRAELGSRLAVQVELNYLEKRNKFTMEYESNPGFFSRGIFTRYIECPVLVAYRVWRRLRLMAGPAIGFRIGAGLAESYANYSNGELEESFEGRWSYPGVFKTIEVSGVFGLQYWISSRVFADVGYSFGFFNSIRKGMDISNVVSLESRVLTVGAGYRF